ncbi:MAG: GTPase [Candidatus Thermoplasmatota archaeon]|nr:GTPase [Candidatus Thermoplasmatota archaeon]
MEKRKRRIIIMGAAGRDFHNFNTAFKDNDEFEVVAFTATQIPDIEGRRYPPALSGDLYPEGIPIIPEEKLVETIQEERIDEVVFAYSDVTHEYVMHKASEVISAGADFVLLGNRETMLKARIPVISVCAGRTGAGKSQTTRAICDYMNEKGTDLVTIRHPMPYGDLEKQAVQRFEDYEDLEKHDTTIEEREEYEPYIDKGMVIYAGVDYGAILREAEKEGDILIWDGGNNDTPFYRPDLHLVVLDPHRVGHETTYHPGEVNLNMADVCIINKCDTADEEDIRKLESNIKEVNLDAEIVRANSPITVDHPEIIKGKKVLVIEDGPTVTHGEMSFGAGKLAAEKYGASEIVDPREYAVGSIKETFEKFSHIEEVLPAMGYSDEQVEDLRKTIENSDCDLVVSGTPIDITRILDTEKPTAHVKYKLEVQEEGKLESILDDFKEEFC